MPIRCVKVIGGGPAGVTAARLLKLRHPDWTIEVFERNSPDATFGFGIGLTPTAMNRLRSADRRAADALEAAALWIEGGEFRLPSGSFHMSTFGRRTIGIERASLLETLHSLAREVGVAVHIGSDACLDEVRDGADLIIAADGVGSGTRGHLAGYLGPTVEHGRGVYIWCGGPTLRNPFFMPVETEHGTFVTHSYPYAPGRSTWVIDTDEETWRRAGLDAAPELAGGESDEAALDYLSAAFADALGGERLIGNASRWLRFRTVCCERWSHENVVLIGDAAATAHPTLGSGTKLAVESAISLCDAIEDAPDVETALERYERDRRPEVERLQDRARRSQAWWEAFPDRLDLGGPRLAAGFFSRAGAVALEELHDGDPALVRSALAEFAGVSVAKVPDSGLTDWVLGQPFSVREHRFAGRLVREQGRGYREVESAEDAAAVRRRLPGAVVVLVLYGAVPEPVGPAADAVVAATATAQAAGADGVRLTGPSSRRALLDRLALGERLRRELSALVVVEGPADYRADLVDGLVAGRADLVAVAAVSSRVSAVNRLDIEGVRG